MYKQTFEVGIEGESRILGKVTLTARNTPYTTHDSEALRVAKLIYPTYPKLSVRCITTSRT